jgi:hypothetical protein
MRSFFGPVVSIVQYPNTLSSNSHERSISQHTIKSATVKTSSALINHYQRPYELFYDSHTHTFVPPHSGPERIKTWPIVNIEIVVYEYYMYSI